SAAARARPDRRYAIDPGKIERELGWSATESFESGLRKTVRWYMDNRAWWEPLRAGVYGGERLGLAVRAAQETPAWKASSWRGAAGRGRSPLRPASPGRPFPGPNRR